MNPSGKPAGPVRLALLAALQAGVVGTLDALARHAGVPADKARITRIRERRGSTFRGGSDFVSY